jgi:membrane protease YdiL (CAAX protease family)
MSGNWSASPPPTNPPVLSAELRAHNAEPINILRLTLFLEGSLLLVAFAWSFFRGIKINLAPTLEHTLIAIALALLLLLLNVLLFRAAMNDVLARQFGILGSLREFFSSTIKPLTDIVSKRNAPIVALLAGLGEETFFRGVLQHETGILFSSLLFSALHFGPRVVKYFPVAFCYFLMSLVFGAVYASSGSLWLVIVAHAVYDYGAILFVKAQSGRAFGNGSL